MLSDRGKTHRKGREKTRAHGKEVGKKGNPRESRGIKLVSRRQKKSESHFYCQKRDEKKKRDPI